MKTELELMLGPRIDALVGFECNLYFEGLLPQQPSEDWEVTISCPLGQHLDERWSLRPEAEHIGVHPFSLRYRDPLSRDLIRAQCELHIHEAKLAGPDLRWLPIGDSITAAATYVEATIARGPRLGTTIRCLGTRFNGHNGTIRHEGYPGWKFGDFHGERASLDANFREQIASAFSLDGSHFNFGKYLETHLDGNEPDFITVFLGTNDIGLLNDETRALAIEKSIRHAETTIRTILDHTRATRIGVIPPLTPGDQNAFGINYGCLLPRWLYRKNQRAMVQALQAGFSRYHERAVSYTHLTLPTICSV